MNILSQYAEGIITGGGVRIFVVNQYWLGTFTNLLGYTLFYFRKVLPVEDTKGWFSY